MIQMAGTEDRLVRTVRTGFKDFDTALAFAVNRYDAELRGASGVQVIIEQDGEGGWSAIVSGTHQQDVS